MRNEGYRIEGEKQEGCQWKRSVLSSRIRGNERGDNGSASASSRW